MSEQRANLKSFTEAELRAQGYMTIDQVIAMLKEADAQMNGAPIRSAIFNISYDVEREHPDVPVNDGISFMAGKFTMEGCIESLDRIETGIQENIPGFDMAYAFYRLQKRTQSINEAGANPLVDVLKKAFGGKPATPPSPKPSDN